MNLNPIKAYRERRERRRKELESEDSPPANQVVSTLGFLRNYPMERRFMAPWFMPVDYIEVPTGSRLIRFEGGKLQPYNPEDCNPGRQDLWPMFKFGESAMVVDMRERQEDICAQEVWTKDRVRLEQLDTIMNYRIFDPHRYAANAEASAKRLATAIAYGQSVYHAGSKEFDELQGEAEAEKLEHRLNIAPLKGTQPHDRLARSGIQITGLYVKSVKPDPKYVEILSAEAEADAQADAQIKLAEGEVKSIDRIVAKIAKMNPAQLAALEQYKILKGLDIHELLAKREGGQTVWLGLPELLDKARGIIGNK